MLLRQGKRAAGGAVKPDLRGFNGEGLAVVLQRLHAVSERRRRQGFRPFPENTAAV